MSLRIGISLGDVTGIGSEVTLKAIASEFKADDTRYVLIGDVEHAVALNRQLGLALPLQNLPASASGSAEPERWPAGGIKNEVGRIFVWNPLAEGLPAGLRPGAPEAARAAVAWVKAAAQLCLAHELDAMVTAPVNKESIIRAGQPFVGQTEMLSELGGTERTAMMLLGTDDRGRWLRVTLATTHFPLRRVADELTQPKVALAIELAARACGDLGLPRARVAVCGLNPHAGEGGKIGTEEQTIIGPAVRVAQQAGLDVIGPMSADALFYYAYRGDYDVVVAMYHDQGLVPLKMVSFESGVNWTLGLPFIRTSPDHGTAYDIAGQGKANPSSMLAAIDLARKLASKRG
jgi:4-hydroxythreonine-4-phosphate dehydrogenase